METSNILILWIIVLNIFGAGVFFWCFARLSPGKIRKCITMMAGITLVLINFSLLVRLPDWPEWVYMVCSKLTLASGMFLHAGIGAFIVFFVKLPRGLRSPGFLLYGGMHLAFTLVLLGSGLILEAASFTEEGGLGVVYGPLHKYWVLFLILSAGYPLFLLRDALRKSDDASYRFEIRLLRWVLVSSFTVVVFFGGVLPVFLGNSHLLPVGLSGLFLLYVGLTYVVNGGKTLYVRYQLAILFANEEFHTLENILTLEKLFAHLKEGIEERPGSIAQRYEFDLGKGLRYVLFLHRTPTDLEKLLKRRDDELDPVERDIVRMAADGVIEEGIAFLLKADHAMVERALERIFKKVGAKDRDQLMEWARNGRLSEN